MKYSIRNFAITFIISLVIFGAIAWGIVGSLKNMSEDILTSTVLNNDDDNNIIDPNETDQDDSSDIFKGKTFNFLAVGMDWIPEKDGEQENPDENQNQVQPEPTGDEADEQEELPSYSTMEAIMLVRADKENKKFVFISLPTDFTINYKGVNMPLGQLTKYLDIDDTEQLNLLLNKFTAMTGLHIDYYAFIDMAHFAQTLDNLGDFTYNAPQDMNYEDEEQNLKINFRKNQLLSKGEDMLKMLRFVTYKEVEQPDDEQKAPDIAKAKDELKRDELQMDFVNALFKKMLTAENMISAPIWVPDILKSTVTNFGLDAMKDNIDLIFSYKEYESVKLLYSENYINYVGEKFSNVDPNKDEVKSAIGKISAAIGKQI